MIETDSTSHISNTFTDYIQTMQSKMLPPVLIFFALLLGTYGDPSNSVNTKKQIKFSNKIIGGNETTIEEHPFVIQLELIQGLRCGGSIYNEYFVITASHCVDGIDPDNLRVRAGATELGTGGTLHDVASLMMHPNFNRPKLDYDVAILRVVEPFVFSAVTSPIALTTVEPLEGIVTVLGWGVSEPETDILLMADIPVVDRQQCIALYDGSFVITERMFCAGKEGHDHCNGDSGGPLVYNGALAGIVSGAVGCAQEGYPGFNANIAHPAITEFIINNTVIS